MNHLARQFFPLAVCALTLTACDDLNQSTSSKSSGASDVLSQSEFLLAFQDLACSNMKKCCTEASLPFDTSNCPSLFNGAGEGAANSVFNPTNGEVCLAELQAKPSCGAKNNAPTCNLVYKGMLGPGEKCTQSLDCARPTGGDANCDPLRGVCIVGLRGALGEECQQSCEQIPDGRVYCAWGPASSGYADGTRITNCFANDGLLCGDTAQCMALASQGTTCVDDTSCSRELFCSAAMGYTCQTKRGLGQSCVEYSMPCVATAYCAGGTCVARKANGERCYGPTECVGACNCGASGDCASNGNCTDPMDPVGSYIAALILAGTCRTAAQ